MEKWHTLLLILLTLFSFAIIPHGIARAATYYVDYSSGNDNNDGLSPSTPWMHAPGDANATGNPAVRGYYHNPLQPGDTVLFKGGVIYRGSITIDGRWENGTVGNPITYKGDGWGSGKAILDGSTPLAGTFAQCSSQAACGGNPNWSNIYYTAVPANYAYDGGYYEDDNFLYYSQGPIIPDPFYWDNVSSWYVIPLGSQTIKQTPSTITDPTVLTQADPNFWVGSYALLWADPSDYFIRKITAYDPVTHTITHDALTAPNLPYTDRDSYYSILNNLYLLNQPGEYYLDETNHKIYIWPRGNNINSHQYSVLNYGTGFMTDASNLVIQGFIIQKYTMGIRAFNNSGISPQNVVVANNEVRELKSNQWYAIQIGGTNMTVQNNRVTDSMRAVGILAGGTNINITGNYVSRTSRQGIWFMGANNSQITHNTVTDIKGQHANEISVYAGSNNILVAHNIVTNGLTPITFEESKNITIFGNFVDAMNGGSNIDQWGGMSGTVAVINNTIVRNNRAASLNFSGTDTSNDVVINNFIDGGGCVSGPTCLTNNNIYTSLSWSQNARYGWSLSTGESVVQNLSSIYVNPTGDFHLKQNSPGINAGISPLSYLPTSQFPSYNFAVDLDGNARPLSGAWDIGAYEYSGSTPPPPSDSIPPAAPAGVSVH